jgi:pimeloyl-ACP methyl ester carboxylesterase
MLCEAKEETESVPHELRDMWTTVNGLSMYARCSVINPMAQPAVVLVHGLGVSGNYLLPTAVHLACHYPTFVPDLPGFGRSSKPSHVLNICELADSLAAWLRNNGLSHTCLVGNSLGCQFIVEIALRYPELVDSAVLVGPTIDSQARSFWKQVGRGVLDMFREPWAYLPLLTWDYLVAGTARTVATLQYAVADPVTAKLSSVDIPVLVVRGEKDPIAPQRWVEEMVQHLPRARLLVIPGAAHVVNYSAGATLAKVVRQFLEEGVVDGG